MQPFMGAGFMQVFQYCLTNWRLKSLSLSFQFTLSCDWHLLPPTGQPRCQFLPWLHYDSVLSALLALGDFSSFWEINYALKITAKNITFRKLSISKCFLRKSFTLPKSIVFSAMQVQSTFNQFQCGHYSNHFSENALVKDIILTDAVVIFCIWPLSSFLWRWLHPHSWSAFISRSLWHTSLCFSFTLLWLI